MDLVEIPEDGTFARHPWEIARYRFFSEVLEPVLNAGAATLLDAGSGDGWLARQLAAHHQHLTVTCFDPGYGEDNVAERLPRSDRVTYVASQPEGPFDVLTLLDVLEHVEDDAGLLASLIEAVRPGGYVLISVPAWPMLFSRHDAALLHFRRYTPRALAAVVERTGMTTVRSGGLFHSLLPPRAAAVAAERVRRGDPDDQATPQHTLEWRGGELSRRVVEAVLSADTRVSHTAADRGIRLPGLSCWALCRRP